jgi:transposase
MPKGQRKYSGEQKVEIIERMHREKLRIMETVGLYGIYHKRICDWKRLYLTEGREALLMERRGRKCTGRPSKLPEQLENDLMAENQRLRMENDYLKKLNVLVLERELQEKKRK